MDALIRGITALDAHLYSEQTRMLLRRRLQTTDPVMLSYLADPDLTRRHLYRFHLKGSNSINIVMYYLEKKYNIEPQTFPVLFDSDWDTTILVNPNLSTRNFNIVFDTLVRIIQRHSIELSRILAALPTFHTNITYALLNTVDILQHDPAYADYRTYPLTYKHTRQAHLVVHDDSKHLLETQQYIQSLGQGGAGLHVTSTRNGGISPNDTTTAPKFYLGRIMASVVASRNIWLPVELLDISMNYQNDDLRFAWDTYSEYRVQYGAYDFRVSSPTCLYFDISKCILNARNTLNQTKKNKVSARTRRLQQLLDTMIVPYGGANLARHTDSSDERIRTIRRSMTRRNR